MASIFPERIGTGIELFALVPQLLGRNETYFPSKDCHCGRDFFAIEEDNANEVLSLLSCKDALEQFSTVGILQD
ncbi:hypothetical protein RIF29_39352 [Crotalaria pallida]|uniref:Uncharacterized protein n=1 Tax=Crotalaria pallida TaxID=3830 RepID=A0AAN9HPJ3_CROPI